MPASLIHGGNASRVRFPSGSQHGTSFVATYGANYPVWPGTMMMDFGLEDKSCRVSLLMRGFCLLMILLLCIYYIIICCCYLSLWIGMVLPLGILLYFFSVCPLMAWVLQLLLEINFKDLSGNPMIDKYLKYTQFSFYEIFFNLTPRRMWTVFCICICL